MYAYADWIPEQRKPNRMSPKLKLLLKIALPAAFVSLCVGISAIALTEISFTDIRRAIQIRRNSSSDTYTSTPTHPEKTSLISTAPTTTSTGPETITREPVTIQSTASIEPQSNQIVLGPLQTHQVKTPIALRPVSTEGFINDPQPIQITPVLPNTIAPDASASTTDRSPQPTASTPQRAVKYGHLPYAEGKLDEMVLVASYAEGANAQRSEVLHPEAAKALLEMTAAARVDGVWLILASGFRTVAEQHTLFDAQIERKGSPEAAAKISAPPGHSEHHTGYAVDLADGALPPSQDISEQFAQSPAYQWLLKNAKDYGFELSFLEDNPQGVNFEPWHWRYVGSTQSREQLGLQSSTASTQPAENSSQHTFTK